MPLKLRSATPDDADALTAIMLRAKASWGYSKAQMTLIRDLYSVTPEELTGERGLIACDKDEPVAYSVVAPQDDGSLLLDQLFVLPEAQGRGIGALLLKRAEDAARKLTLRRVVLESDANAESFYLRHGFTTRDTRPSRSIEGQRTPLMEKTLPSAVHVVDRIDLRVSSEPWAFETANKAEIASHYAFLKKNNPHLWNGQTLKLVDYAFENGVFSGTCAHCDYSSFLAWRDWGAPDMSCFNLFGSAVLVSSDKALLYGVMGPKTATAGLIYPPGGNLDPADLAADGTIDIEGSIRRELTEETGISAAETELGGRIVTFDGPRISIGRIFRLDQPADAVKDRILAHSRSSEEEELSDIHIVRRPEDLTNPAIVSYAREIGLRFLQNEL